MKKLLYITGILVLWGLYSCTELNEPINESKFDPPKESIKRIKTKGVSLEEAREDLTSLLKDQNEFNTRNGILSNREISSAYTYVLQDSVCGIDTIARLHVFNFDTDQGYAIMSGETWLPSLLVLTDNGNLNENQIYDHPGMLIFSQLLDDMVRNIGELDHTNSFDGYFTYDDWVNTFYPTGGLCNVKWGQRTPYNNYCPIKNGSRTLTGCVATAVAQLMSIYEYPSSQYIYTFNWNNMKASPYAIFCDSTGQENIARLMRILGFSSNLDNNYGVEGTGADEKNVPRTLRAFGYSSGGVIENYDTTKVISELTQGYPVLACGYSNKSTVNFLGFTVHTTYSGGHVWLIHGLLRRTRQVHAYSMNNQYLYSYTETKWYPLCNWGWNGSHDGYYYNNIFNANLNPEFPNNSIMPLSDPPLLVDSAYNYRYNIKLIRNIRR